MKSRIPVVLLILILLFALSCKTPITSPKPLVCPIPTQNCNPNEWDGIPIDTSIELRETRGYYYAIEPVSSLNTPYDEWAIAFDSKNTALMTFTDSDRQRLLKVRMVNPTEFMMISPVLSDIDGHIGAATFSGNEIALAVITDKDYSKAFYAEHDGSLLGSLETMHGMSRLYSGIIRDEVLDAKPLESLEDGINVFNWESQPAFSPDGNTMVFASDREGGKGGTDLWISTKTASGWSKPQNCGAVNTKCDELTPYINSDGRALYFASAGHETVGGYDIFKSEIESNLWSDIKSGRADIENNSYFSRPSNFKAPVNTQYDELFPSCPGDCDSILFYSSNQTASTGSMLQSGGGFDIFVFHRIGYDKLKPSDIVRKDTAPEIPVNIKQEKDIVINPYFNLKGKVVDAATKQPVPNSEIVIRELPSPDIKYDYETNVDGTYEITLEKGPQYEVTAQAENLFYDSYKVSIPEDDTTSEIVMDFHLPEKLTLRINFPFDDYQHPYLFVLDSNGIQTSRTWHNELDLLSAHIKSEIAKLEKMILIGHTDPIGTIEYNDRLSRRRANFVESELIKRGIPESFMETRAMGENDPLSRKDGESKDAYHKRLRRVVIQKVYK